MPMPPWDLVWPKIYLIFGPALGVSLIVMFLIRHFGGEKLAPMAAALAFAAGVMTADYLSDDDLFQIYRNRALNAEELRTQMLWALETKPQQKPPDDPETPGVEENPLQTQPARYWLPWLAVIAMIVELLFGNPAMPVSLGWIARAFTAILAGRLLVSEGMRVEMPAAPWLMSLAIMLVWAVTTNLVREWRDGSVAFAIALCFAVAGGLGLFIGYTKLFEIGLLITLALLGPALVTAIWPGNIASALAAGSILLPGLMLTAYHDRDAENKVPFFCYLLAGLSPLAMAPMLLQSLIHRERWRHWLPAIVLALIPAAAAVALAAQYEKIEIPGVDHAEIHLISEGLVTLP